MQTESPLLVAALRTVFLRDLKAVDAEIAAYPDEASLWLTPSGIGNSGGTLALHIAGNVRHFIGAVLGKTGYVRDRDAEFGSRNVPREKIRADVAAAIDEVMSALAELTDSDLAREFPILIGSEKLHVRTCDWLVHLVAHLGYHLGQINYHRRLVTPDPVPTDNLSLRELAIEQ